MPDRPGIACELDQPARDDTFLSVLRVRVELRRDVVSEQIGREQPRVAATGEPAAQQVGGGPQAGRLDVAREKLASASASSSASESSLAPATVASSRQAPWVTLILQVLLWLRVPIKASPGPSGLTPITGEMSPTKASQVAYRAKPWASGWIASPKT